MVLSRLVSYQLAYLFAYDKDIVRLSMYCTEKLVLIWKGGRKFGPSMYIFECPKPVYWKTSSFVLEVVAQQLLHPTQ